MAIKLVMGTKSGKTFQKELSSTEAESLFGRVLGEELNGEMFGYSGVKFTISGGSDAQGFPMRKDLTGTSRKSLLIAKSTGFKGKLRGQKFGGLRIKRTVAGNTVDEKTHQVDLGVTEGAESLETAFATAEEPAKEE